MSSPAREKHSAANAVGVVVTAPRPAPEVTRLVQLSCQRLFVVQSQFADSFHHMLDELAPSMHVLPPAQGTALTAGLAHCVLWAALTQDSPDVVEATVQRVGADNHQQGFPDDAFPGVGHALLRGVRATLPVGWSSELSSAWVAYYLWLDAHLRLGADLARSQEGTSTPGFPADGVAGGGSRRFAAGPGVPAMRATSLDAVLQHLRATYFEDNERGLGSVCTRVMLRTGADLRAPRPDQRTDPVVIAQVLESLLLMGFTPAAAPPGSATASASPAASDGMAARYSSEPATASRRRWSLRRRRRELRPQRLAPTDPEPSNRDRR